MSPIRIEAGPMFSGKTSALLREIKKHVIAKDRQGVDFLVFNHSIDERYGNNCVSSHDEGQYPAIPLTDSLKMIDIITEGDDTSRSIRPEYARLNAIFVDEAQFFDPRLPEVLAFLDSLFLAHNGYGLDVICAGLDTDFAGRPFGPMPDLMARAVSVHKHTAVCTATNGDGKHCKNPATFTQRLIDGRPPRYHDPVVMVGAAESYTARCRHHHQVEDIPIPRSDQK